MSLKIILILLALSGIGGIVLGYVLRVLIGLAQKGSVELDIKQKLLAAKEQAAKIIAEAEFRGEVFETERLAPIEEREEKLTMREEHIVSREEFLDSRQRLMIRRMKYAFASRMQCVRKARRKNLPQNGQKNLQKSPIFQKKRRVKNFFLKLNTRTKKRFFCGCKNLRQTVANGLKIKRVLFSLALFIVSGMR